MNINNDYQEINNKNYEIIICDKKYKNNKDFKNIIFSFINDMDNEEIENLINNKKGQYDFPYFGKPICKTLKFKIKKRK